MDVRPAGLRSALTFGLVACAIVGGAAAQPIGDSRGSAATIRDVGSPDLPPTPPPTPSMGFVVHFDLAAVPQFQNIYVVAVPYQFGLMDIADSAAPDPCDPSGANDGVVNADDMLCAFWSSRAGSMSVSRRDEPSGTWQTRTALRDDTTGSIQFMGSWLDPLVPGEGFLVQVAGPGGGPVSNPTTVAGSSQDHIAWQVLRLPASGSKQVSVINVPYHTMQQTADEILCGLEGVDWIEGPDGNPTTCLTGTGSYGGGIYDSVSGAPMTIMTFDNIADGNGTDNQWVWRTVSRDPAGGGLVFEGTDFEAWRGTIGTPGLLAQYGPPFLTSVFRPYHF